MAARIARLIALGMIAAALTGCGTTKPARFYALDSTAVADGSPPTPAAVLVGPVTIPASVDQPEFVVQVAPNQVDVDEFNRWVAPLNDGIARAVAGDLVVLLGTPNVGVAPLANFIAAYRVTIDVQRFDSVLGKSALIEAVWTVQKTANAETRSGRTVAREVPQGPGFGALAAAYSRALARLSADIAVAIRSEAAQKPSSESSVKSGAD